MNSAFTADSRFRCGFLMNSRTGAQDSCFRCGFLMNSELWHHRFKFPLRISNEFYVLAPQIRVSAADF